MRGALADFGLVGPATRAFRACRQRDFATELTLNQLDRA